MAFLVEARDPYTGGHLWRVSQYATRLALANFE
jgi:HD-GYP domain-containing protein (c-di-GMP phosphodiesterase class II)